MRFHLSPFEVIVSRKRVLNLSRFTYKEAVPAFPLKARARELMAGIYALFALALIIESKYKIFVNINLERLIDETFLRIQLNSNFVALLLSFVVVLIISIDFVFNRYIARISDARNFDNFQTPIAGTNVSAESGATIRASHEGDHAMSQKLLKPTPLTPEEYRKIAKNPNYRSYLEHRQMVRESRSHDVHPVDGGPTDEAILLEYLKEQND